MQTKPAQKSMIRGEEPMSAPTTNVPLGLEWVAALEPRDRGALLRLHNPQRGTVDVEIVLTVDGPVIRAAAAALEITAATEIAARCARFSVEAGESFSVRAGRIEHDASGSVRASGGEVALTARSGGVAIRANDDVALSGEQILLNCDRDPPWPGWIPLPRPEELTVPATNRQGDPELLRVLDEV
jgi:hypothetical protein